MNDNDLAKYRTVFQELKQLYNKVTCQMEECSATDRYIYSSTYSGWIHEYNEIVKKYNSLTGSDLSFKHVQEYELSSTQKTVRTNVVSAFASSIKDFMNSVQTEIQSKQTKEEVIPEHQMRVCFKLGLKKCPINPALKPNKIFVATPFSDDYKDSYEYGIKFALEQLGLEYYRADNEVSNRDIMCKICQELQSCGKVIANISGLNPNVMLELGLAYGLGKKVIIVKDKKTNTISDLGSVEYIEYAHAGELQKKLYDSKLLVN